MIATLRDIAVVIIALEVFIILLIPAAITYLMVRGVGWLQRQVRTYGPEVRRRVLQVEDITKKTAPKAAEPVILVNENTARIQRMRAALAAAFASKEV